MAVKVDLSVVVALEVLVAVVIVDAGVAKSGEFITPLIALHL